VIRFHRNNLWKTPRWGIWYPLAALLATVPLRLPQGCLAQAGYEVVSIHRAAPGDRNSGFSDAAQGGVRARNVTTLQVLLFAYDIQDYQLAGVPGWARSERFEINFTPAEAEPPIRTEAGNLAAKMDQWSRQRQRLQAVLHDRFNLVLHSEAKEMPIYVLKVARGGPKLRPPAHPENLQTQNFNSTPAGRRLVSTTATMDALAVALQASLGRPVHNETGLGGTYDFTVEWGTDLAPAADAGKDGTVAPVLPSIFTALSEQLGLRLEPQKGPVPVFVIDRIEPPSVDE
jgi:uncharacterized protein (TIGR03435 family)